MIAEKNLDHKLNRCFEASTRSLLSLACIRIVAVRFSPRRIRNEL